MGQEDPSFSPSPVEPLSQGGSREEAEQWSHQSEPSDKVQEFVLEAQCMASYQTTLDCISSHGSKPKGVSKRKLAYVGECMLWDWYQPECNTVLTEYKVFGKLFNLKLTPEQQSSVDSSIWMDQWALGKSQVSQLFKNLQKQLISSINV